MGSPKSTRPSGVDKARDDATPANVRQARHRPLLASKSLNRHLCHGHHSVYDHNVLEAGYVMNLSSSRHYYTRGFTINSRSRSLAHHGRSPYPCTVPYTSLRSPKKARSGLLKLGRMPQLPSQRTRRVAYLQETVQVDSLRDRESSSGPVVTSTVAHPYSYHL